MTVLVPQHLEYRDWQPDSLFLGYQRDWIKDAARLKIAEKSRQIGFTWCSAYRHVRQKSLQGAKLDSWISSRDEIQARLFLQECGKFAKILNTAAKDLGQQVLDAEKGISAFVMRMATGCALNSMSSNPDAQAGKVGDRVLDEFALHPDARALYSIAYPGITWGGSMELFSTHRGTHHFFNELIREIKEKGNPKKFSLHTITLQDALDYGFLAKLKTKLPADDERQQMDEAEYFDFIKAGCADEETFMQEYMCIPADDEAAFLPWELIIASEYSKNAVGWEIPSPDLAVNVGELYAGVDVGRDHDLTVLWILEKIHGRFFTRKIIELQAMPFYQQEQILYPWFRLCRKVAIDQNGIGRQFTENAQRTFGEWKVEGFKFTQPSKEEIAFPVRSTMEDRALLIPSDTDNKAIRHDLRGIRKETTSHGNIRFTADRGKNGHSDRFWALALALHCARNHHYAFGFETAQKPDITSAARQSAGRVVMPPDYEELTSASDHPSQHNQRQRNSAASFI